LAAKRRKRGGKRRRGTKAAATAPGRRRGESGCLAAGTRRLRSTVVREGVEVGDAPCSAGVVEFGANPLGRSNQGVAPPPTATCVSLACLRRLRRSREGDGLWTLCVPRAGRNARKPTGAPRNLERREYSRTTVARVVGNHISRIGARATAAAPGSLTTTRFANDRCRTPRLSTVTKLTRSPRVSLVGDPSLLPRRRVARDLAAKAGRIKA
jgi:hypothetical protein